MKSKAPKRAKPPVSRFLTREGAAKIAVVAVVCVLGAIFYHGLTALSTTTYERGAEGKVLGIFEKEIPKPVLDEADYDLRMRNLAHIPAMSATSTATSTATTTPKKQLWPVTDAPYPLPGALLPFNRILAYYGNFYSTKMGALGEYPEDQMLSMLKDEAARWEAADPDTPVIPAIHYIVETAQGSPGKEGKYMLRMPDTQVDHAVELAKKVDGIVFLDFQVGLSDIRNEVPMYESYFMKPEVHLGIDPEFYMKSGDAPGEVVGTMDAADVNWAAEYLAKLVREHGLPPKILVIHRFTQNMLTNYQNIKPLPEVQIVIEMDGWGEPAKKKNTYARVITPEPVQFTGFKIFYKNDLKPPSTRLMTPEEVLNLMPSPIYIQYQ